MDCFRSEMREYTSSEGMPYLHDDDQHRSEFGDPPVVVPYAKDYNTCIQEAKQRIGNAPIIEKLTDISDYDTIFVMSPIYWGTYAPEMETALTGLDFAGKTVRVISTHEGSGLASMVSDVKKMCKGANVDMKGLAIKGSQAKKSKQKVADWL